MTPSRPETQGTLAELRSRVSAEEWALWLENTSLEAPESPDRPLRLGFDSHFKKDKFQRSYLTLFRRILADTGAFPGHGGEIVLAVRGAAESSRVGGSAQERREKPEFASAGEGEAAPATAPLPEFEAVTDGLLPELAFDGYVEFAENSLALACVRRATSRLGESNPLYFFGAPGCGKTHLLHAVGNRLRRDFPFLRIRVVNPHVFVKEYRQALDAKNDRPFRARYRNLDVLLFDDIQFLAGKRETGIEFFQLFNDLLLPGRQMVFTSDQHPSELKDLDVRIKSRLGSGLIAEIGTPGVEAKKRLLEAFAKRLGLEIPGDTLDFLSASLPGDARMLLGAVKTLTVAREVREEPIGEEFCRAHLGRLLAPRLGKTSPSDLVERVCRYARLSLEDLSSPRRDPSLAFYRQIAWYLLRRDHGLSFSDAGRLLGGRKASTVSEALQVLEKRMAAEPMVKQVIDTLSPS